MEDQKKEGLTNEEITKALSKEIIAKNLSTDMKTKISQILKNYEELSGELNKTKDSFLEYNNKLNSKIEELTSQHLLDPNKLDIAQYEQSLKKYEALLESVIQEVEQDCQFYKDIFAGNMPEKFTVLKWASDDSDKYLEDRVMGAKKYIKNTQKNLRITFSRHKLNFENQLRELDYFQMYVKNQANKK